jgi:TonB family protein
MRLIAGTKWNKGSKVMRDLKSVLRFKRSQGFLSILCLVVLSSHAVPADKKQHQQEALQFLNRVRETTNIAAPDSPPFQLRAHVVAAPVERGRPQHDGTYALTWASPDRWREEITFPGYHRVRVAAQKKLWTAADLPFEPVRVYELSQLFDLRSQWTLQPDESANLQKAKNHKGVDTQCVEVRSDLEPGREVCADASSSLPLRMEMLMPYNPLRTSFEYAEFQPSGGKQFPRVMRAFEGKSLALEVRVDELAQNLNPDESIFAPPTQAVSWDWCADAEPARAIEKSAPRYPEAAKASRQQGVVSVYAVVGVDGSLNSLAVVRSAGRDFDAATLAAMARWRYRPAVCGGKPTPFETVIDVAYTLQE